MPRKKLVSRGYSSRRVDIREVRQRFLIVCEGEKTEPNYFKSFRVPGIVVKVHGLGTNPSKLVEEAKDLQTQDEYNQVWCVFDRNSWIEEDFNSAITSANKEGFQVAYSNEAFELWYILHFEFLNTGISRNDYIKKLDCLLKQPYQKNSDTLYDELYNKQEDAIKNAENLLSQYDPCNPARDNPSTTVHLLVKELKKFAR